MNLYRRLEEVLGREEATTFMELVPPVGWADVATNQGLAHLQAATKKDMDLLALALRGEMAELASDLRGEMAELASDLRGEMAELASDLRGEMKDGFAAVQRDLRLQLLSILAFNLTFFGAAVALL